MICSSLFCLTLVHLPNFAKHIEFQRHNMNVVFNFSCYAVIHYLFMQMLQLILYVLIFSEKAIEDQS